MHGPQVQALSANALLEHLRRLDGLSQGPDFRVITGAVKLEAARAELGGLVLTTAEENQQHLPRLDQLRTCSERRSPAHDMDAKFAAAFASFAATF